MTMKEKSFRKGITVFELELYSTEDGKEPVAQFLDSLDECETDRADGTA